VGVVAFCTRVLVSAVNPHTSVEAERTSSLQEYFHSRLTDSTLDKYIVLYALLLSQALVTACRPIHSIIMLRIVSYQPNVVMRQCDCDCIDYQNI